ncbi:MAG: hypothetical protein JXQ71_08210 [Verrucomicrobia bacterium]|nr:hypothetical protein [Verrucomicrobiota bacterium]
MADHWLTRGKTCVAVAKEFGVHSWNLRHWKRRLHSVAKRPMHRCAKRPGR